MCTVTILGKHRPKERESKKIQEERSPRRFQGVEEEVERGKI
jgi:hypothetical protein